MQFSARWEYIGRRIGFASTCFFSSVVSSVYLFSPYSVLVRKCEYYLVLVQKETFSYVYYCEKVREEIIRCARNSWFSFLESEIYRGYYTLSYTMWNNIVKSKCDDIISRALSSSAIRATLVKTGGRGLAWFFRHTFFVFPHLERRESVQMIARCLSFHPLPWFFLSCFVVFLFCE